MITQLGIDSTRIDATPQFDLGLEVEEIKGGNGQIVRNTFPNGIPTLVAVTTNYTANRRFRYVRADAAIAAGDVCMKKFGEADDPHAFVKTAATTDFGEGIAEVAVTDQYYFWLTVHGYVADANVADAVTQGQFIAPSATAGRLDAFTFTTTAATLAQLEAGFRAAVAGIQAMTAGSAGNRAAVFIHGN